ncbi:MAG: FAD-dependent oxidoreductase [Candidatus Woesearchaeota archaeon]
MHDVMIIGLGPGGAAAAIYARRFNMKSVCFYTDLGLLSTAHKVENWPGVQEAEGYTLCKSFFDHASSLGAEIIPAEVEDVEKISDGFKVKASGKAYEAKTLIIATGAKHRKLNVPGEKEFSQGRGVSYCATCDAPMFKDKVVCVVGGSDAAAMSALKLAEHASKVYIIYRKERIRSRPSLTEAAEKNQKIDFIYKANIVEILGDKMVSKVKLDTGKQVEVEGVFVEIGSEPSNGIAKTLGLELEGSLIKVNEKMETSVKGVYAAGDVTTGSNRIRQGITAAAEGCIAATSAFAFLTGRDVKLQASN